MDPWQPHLLRSTPYRRWLRLPGSLTHVLMRCCPSYNVVRLSQAPGLAHPDEGGVRGLP